MSNTKSIPEGYHSVTPYISHKNADAAIKFYEQAFGAREVMRLRTPEGGVAHAEIQIGDSRIMMADESPVYGNKSAGTIGGSPVSFLFYVESDVDAAFDRAIKAGATVKRPLEDQFYGDRVGTLVDPFGIQWSIGMHKEDVSDSEMQRRMEKMFAAQ